MRTSTAIRIKTYNGAYAGSVIARKRKIQRVKSAFISSLKFAGVLLSSFAAVIGGYEGYRHVVSSSYFNISHIAIEGNAALKRDDIISLCNIRIGQNIFSVDIEDIYKGLKNHPWIKDAAIKKELPDRLSIKITERNPAAAIKSNGTYMIDSEGVVLREVSHVSDVLSEDAERGLPIIVEPESFKYKDGERVNSTEVLDCIDVWRRVKDIKPVLNGVLLEDEIVRIEPINHKRVRLYLKDRNEYIVLDSENIDRNFRHLQIVTKSLHDGNTSNPQPGDKGKGRELDYIDLSYKDKVIVKYNDK